MSGYLYNHPKGYVRVRAEPVNRGEEYFKEREKYGLKYPPEPEKTEVKLRIGVFFDGTGNNASNSEVGLRCGAHHPIEPKDIDASCKPYMSDPEGSYGGEETNVAKLFQLYQQTEALKDVKSGQKIFLKMYIEGIGTVNGEEDSMVGFVTGRGATGVPAKVYEAFDNIIRQIDKLIRQIEHCQIVLIDFDVFGFSRGAAAARHFANEVFHPERQFDQFLQQYSKYFARGLDRKSSHLRVTFVGLFDTVASIAALGNFGNLAKNGYTGDIDLYLDPKTFRNVVHLVARDEYRGNFPVSSVAPDHLEITLPGAHSDIGGGYLQTTEECVLISPMQALDVSLSTEVSHTSIYHHAAQVKAQWIAKGWPEHMLEIVTPPAKELPVPAHEQLAPKQKRVYAALQLKRPVQGGLSRIYLHVMHHLAKQHHVNFEVFKSSEPRYAIPPPLLALTQRFISGNYSTTPDEEQLLRLDYIHTSAHWNRPVNKIHVIYAHAPTDDAVRLIHPHVRSHRP